MNVYPIARLPDHWIAQAKAEGAFVDLSLKSPWQFFGVWEYSTMHGFVGLLLISSRNVHVRGWYVFPEYRGTGVGGALLEAALDWCRINGYSHIDIRTFHNVAWAGFIPTGYQRGGGNRESQWVMDLVS